MSVNFRFQNRHNTAAGWASDNPTLLVGEQGIESDTHNIKVGDGSTAWNSLPYAQSATYEAGSGKRIYVSPNGNDSNNGKTMSMAKLTLAAALTAMGAGVKGTIVMDSGVISAGATCSWATFSCGLVGPGTQSCFVTATAQTGPVLDLSSNTAASINGCEFGGFTIQGDGTAGSTKKGIAFPAGSSATLINLHDVSVTGTGGAPFDFGQLEQSALAKLTANEPVSVVANNVPYFTATGAFNGNTMRDFKCESPTSAPTGNVGVSGAIAFADNGTFAPTGNKIDSLLIENLHVATGGTIVAIAGNANTISDPQFFDCSKVTGATGTSHIRFSAPAVTDFGGNALRGLIPGHGTNTLDIDMGVDMRQSNNVPIGTKGFKGTNVVLASGVGHTSGRLYGGYSGASDPGFVDNSGVFTNTLIDEYAGPAQKLIVGRYYGVPGSYTPATAAGGDGFFTATPFILTTGQTFDRISAEVTTLSTGNLRLGIYGSVAGSALPGTLILDAGTVLATSVAVVEATISQVLPPGLYWLVTGAQGGNPTLRGIGLNSQPPVAPTGFAGTNASAGANAFYATGISGALPGTWPGANATSNAYKTMLRCSA